MEDTSRDKPSDEDMRVARLAGLIAAHKGRDTVSLDLRALNTWTDFFIISTVSSSTHLKGLMRHIKECLQQLGLETIHKHTAADEDEWSFIDCGDIVIHLMSERARAFYDLERLWFEAPARFFAEPAQPAASVDAS